MAKKPLSEQVVVVTGASAGLGRAIARLAGAHGAHVVLAARGDGLDAAVAEVGANALGVHLFVPLPGDHGARGRYTSRARPTTSWTSLRLRRRLVGSATAAVAAVAPTIARAVARR
jgi:NAD(P)-dependent dehydrogenase (short-subunit alcohol dehydrogenase family)